MKIPSYIAPSTLEEALDLLDHWGAGLRVLAGGTDVMTDLRTARLKSHSASPTLLDVSAIPELQKIRMEAGRLFLGAAVTFQTLEHDPQLKKLVPVLSAAASQMGSVQVRRLATIGGNVGTASPAGDGITPLTALEAQVQIASRKNSRIVPLTGLITGPGRTGLAADELIHSFILNLPEEPECFFFSKIMRRQAVAIARMNLAVQVALTESGEIRSARIAAGAVFPAPRRLQEVEQMLVGRQPEEGLFEECGRRAVEALHAVSGRRPSMAYKEPALERLVIQGLKQACGVLPP
jgi:CO/xanthine dehydrogenase FAD-binding subunit